MASLVEKETGLASERPDIAGVFVREAAAWHAAAQTDPAVIWWCQPVQR
ncbi:MAG: endolytic transglycosylase MltG [Anaerolineales bacterium]|nr:endolytic transglycosylase MltG [Anaerolineales bacterium]